MRFVSTCRSRTPVLADRVTFCGGRVGDSSTVEQRTLTPSILVRIQVPRPDFSGVSPLARVSATLAGVRLREAETGFDSRGDWFAYVRGNTADFYDWLRHLKRGPIPEGPPVCIWVYCHVGNLGPLAHSDGRVEIQIRDLDQTVIGNPIHDLVRLGLSLASAARGSDLPGVTTARILEQIIEGYAAAMEVGQTGEEGDDIPEAMRDSKVKRRLQRHKTTY